MLEIDRASRLYLGRLSSLTLRERCGRSSLAIFAAFHAPTLEVPEASRQRQLLAMFGFIDRNGKEVGGRFALIDRSTSARVDVVETGQAVNFGKHMPQASVHHHRVFGRRTTRSQLHWRSQLCRSRPARVPRVIRSRQYFHSIFIFANRTGSTV